MPKKKGFEIFVQTEKLTGQTCTLPGRCHSRQTQQKTCPITRDFGDIQNKVIKCLNQCFAQLRS